MMKATIPPVIRYKCPHCGEVFAARKCLGGSIPTHDFPKLCRQVCCGSGQCPRSLADRRPLWKDDPEVNVVLRRLIVEELRDGPLP